jgi:cytoskeletal protein RodZ
MSFGDELRRERELRRISLREVAEATKVNIRYLEAMERNDFVHLPGGVFNRGFVRAYAQFIGIDPEAMVNAYLLEEQAQIEPPPATGGAVLRGTARAPARPMPAARPAPPRPARAQGPSLLHWGLLVLATGILAVVGYLVFDVLRDRPGPFPGGRSAAPVATHPDG